MRPLAALPPALRAEAAEQRTYGNADLAPLDWQLRARLDEQTTRVGLDGIAYLASERAVNQGLWRIVLLDDEAPARAAARNAAISAALACAVLWLLVVAVAQRRRAVRQQQASRLALQAAHDNLETRVVERTAELRALRWLERTLRPADRVLDYGCGSGILALAAAKLGAAAVVAVDLDPQALEAAAANARANAVALQLADPEHLPAGDHDLIVANILARPLAGLVPIFAARTRVGARIALSGVLAAQAAELIAAYRPYFALRPGAREEGWALLEGTRR